ncbi:MAG: hypothetical protein KGO52_03195 [Nitrospirota bacterium]|nr:hypothetical protein [Nitrospirota bacterium]MDE3034352.1 hypothetical protein [Nitrospirota bacterium]MDE3118426.1 hypothetical protein [Nitrospirota bacterium]MDE3224159.1 hypothetical protein [Nitrospirota bacterium]MDE3241710.1 hypothetical protein [Nitrospirota bacterium]
MADDPQTRAIRDEFRGHLELFYATLKLAPPYHSVEKAIAHLTAALNAMAPTDRALVAAEPARRWVHYKTAFIESGLSQKHRGIIAGLARSGRTGLPAEYQAFLDAYLS